MYICVELVRGDVESRGRRPTDDEDAQVVGAEIVEGVVQQLLRGGLGVVGAVGDEVDRFLVRADVPQLRRRGKCG